MTIERFKKTIRDYYAKNGRPMPWRATKDPYRILVSEIMLQQTQVSRVEKFYKNFIKRFPNFRALARAKIPDVLSAWQGLGYNRRALALQKLAKEVVENYGGRLPSDAERLMALPGVGKYTAGAIRAFAFNQLEIFIETNIRRVFIHFFFLGRKNVTDEMLRRYIEGTIDRKNPREWYYALMDYGAMLGESARTSKIAPNPNRRSAHYVRQSVFGGSDREIRGKILRELLKQKKTTPEAICSGLRERPERISRILLGLNKEGFVVGRGKYIQLAD